MREINVGRKRYEVPHSLLDRVIERVAPVMARDRLRAKLSIAMATGGYAGASKSRRSLTNWNPGTGSADSDTLTDLPDLRGRARDMVRNNPIATGILSNMVSHVVGTGLSLQSRIDGEYLGLTDDEATAWQRNTEREFALWAESTNCDAARHLNFYRIQSLALRSTLENGDILPLLTQIERPGWPYRLAVQLIEADRVCNPHHKADTATLAGGIEMNPYGERIAAHICKTHPGDIRNRSLEWDRVPFYSPKGRRQLLHVMDPKRVGQTRGVPELAPVIEPLKQLGRYTEAELQAAVIAGLFTVFIKTEPGMGADAVLAPDASAQGSGGAAGKSWDGSLGNGLAVDLNAGESIETANPGRPNQAFDPFVAAIITQIGIALDIPKEVLTKHYQSSYSAARAAMLDAWRTFRARRDWLGDTFCQPIYDRWLEEAVAIGRVEARGFFTDPMARRAWGMADWIGDGPGSLDPVKEVAAAGQRIKLGTSTRANESLLHDGLPWEQKHKQLAREARMRREDGLDIEPVAERAEDNLDSDKESK